MRLYILSLTISLIFCLTTMGQTVAPANLLQKLVDLPAPAPFKTGEKTAETKERPKEFFDEENVPPDDAPIEDLLAYWEGDSGIFPTTYKPKPSAKTVERILEYCEEHPEKASRYLSVFPPKPEIGEAVKAIYDKLTEAQSGDTYRIREWLKYNSTIYLDELVKGANGIRDENNYVQNANQYFLRALARVDWDTALPIVSRLENDPTNPYSQILAKWVTYQHALDTGDSSTADTYRRQLQKIVEDRNATWAQRDLAMDSLTVSNDWEGRDEWYLSLLEDETLLTIQEHNYTGLTTLIVNSPRKKWLEKMIELTKSANLAVRSAAARNLMDRYDEGNTEILTALLPWLANEGWAKQSGRSERSTLIKAYGDADVPEAVPSLIAIVMNEEEHRGVAAAALARYKDPRAIPALRSVLATQETQEDRKIFIGAILACGGFSDEEQMAALEAYATMMSTPEGEAAIEAYENRYNEPEYDEDEEDSEEGASEGVSNAGAPSRIRSKGDAEEEPEAKPLPLQISIGSFIGAQEEPGEGLVARAVQRLKALQRTNPPVAAALAGIMEKWKGRAMYIEILRRIRSDEAGIDDILLALANRKEMREKVPSELAAMRGGGAVARAIGACVAEDPAEYLSILGGDEPGAQTAMLGCTRMLRAPLPVREVGELLNSTDKPLALAATRYLESEDSLEARKMVLAKNKGAALILGARTAFVPDIKSVYSSYALLNFFQSVTEYPLFLGEAAPFKKKEDDLRRELQENPELTAVYAMLPTAETGRKVLRVYKEKIVFTYDEDTARYWEKSLTKEEYEAFYNLLIEKNVDALQPLAPCLGGCLANEFVMFGRDGGRRVFYKSSLPPPPFDKVSEIFDSFLRSEDVKLHYFLADKLPGLEVLWSDEKRPARAVWAKDADIRFLVEDKAKEKEMEEATKKIPGMFVEGAEEDDAGRMAKYKAMQKRLLELKYAHFGWRKIEDGRPGGPVAQPPETPFLYDHTQVPEIPSLRSAPRSWQARTPSCEIRTGEYYESGLYRVSPGQDPVQIKEGMYGTAIVTGDGRWAIASKTEEEPKEFSGIVRVNLQTGREFKTNIPGSESPRPIAFIASHNKVLIYAGNRSAPDGEGEDADGPAPARRGARRTSPPRKTSEFYLLDAATGAIQPVRGEFRPLETQTYRPLQATGNPGESWAAIYDPKTQGTNIGRYNERAFSFKTALNIPNISLDSMAVWVDEKAGKVYFVYEGHLLSLPMAMPAVRIP